MMRLVLCALLLIVPASASALEGLKPGDAAPRFSLPDLAVGRITLGDLAGAPGAIVFWSTWSPRSAEVLADFAARHAEWSAAGLRVVAVNADRERLDPAGRAAVERYVAGMNLPFPVVVDEGLETYAAYGVMALPTTVLVDPGGRISYALAGYPFTLREELEGQVALALGPGAPGGPNIAATSTEPEPGLAPGTACPIPRVRAARAADGTVVELSATVLALLERHWREGKTAPGEKRILEIFPELAALRDCRVRLATGG